MLAPPSCHQNAKICLSCGVVLFRHRVLHPQNPRHPRSLAAEVQIFLAWQQIGLGVMPSSRYFGEVWILGKVRGNGLRYPVCNKRHILKHSHRAKHTKDRR